MILLVVDTQSLITNERLYKFDEFVSNVERLINVSRENDIEVVYVRHDDGDGSEITKGVEGFEIYERFKPLREEKIFDKIVNSPFKQSGVLEYLKVKEVKDIVVVGLQSDYCIDATVKCGFEHGFNMIVPSYANSTVDNEYMTKEDTYRYYNEFIWKNRYAECISVNEVIERMKKLVQIIY